MRRSSKTVSENTAALKIQHTFQAFDKAQHDKSQHAIETSVYSKLLRLFDLRFQCMRAVAAAKFVIHKPIEDLAQEARVIDAAVTLAKKSGILDLKSIEQIFRENITLAKTIQEGYSRIWHVAPRDTQTLINNAYRQLSQLANHARLSGLTIDRESQTFTANEVLNLARDIIAQLTRQIIGVLSNQQYDQKPSPAEASQLVFATETILTNYLMPTALRESNRDIHLLVDAEQLPNFDKPSNLTVVTQTDFDEVIRHIPGSGANFTNGTYAPPANIILDTTLTGFEFVISRNNLPIVVAINSDESMRNLRKTDFESQHARANKIAIPLARKFTDRQVIIIFYDDPTPTNLYHALSQHGITKTLHKWGYGTEPNAPKIEGAEFFEKVYAFPLPNDTKPVCYYETALPTEPQKVEVIDLRDQMKTTAPGRDTKAQQNHTVSAASQIDYFEYASKFLALIIVNSLPGLSLFSSIVTLAQSFLISTIESYEQLEKITDGKLMLINDNNAESVAQKILDRQITVTVNGASPETQEKAERNIKEGMMKALLSSITEKLTLIKRLSQLTGVAPVHLTVLLGKDKEVVASYSAYGDRFYKGGPALQYAIATGSLELNITSDSAQNPIAQRDSAATGNNADRIAKATRRRQKMEFSFAHEFIHMRDAHTTQRNIMSIIGAVVNTMLWAHWAFKKDYSSSSFGLLCAKVLGAQMLFALAGIFISKSHERAADEGAMDLLRDNAGAIAFFEDQIQKNQPSHDRLTHPSLEERLESARQWREASFSQ